MGRIEAGGPMAAVSGGACRVIRPLDLKTGFTDDGDENDVRTAAVLDVETTGLDPEAGSVIQLAIRQVDYDGDGVITWIGDPHEWLQDPGCPITPEITALTGIRDEDVQGKSIDFAMADNLLYSSSLVVAHHSRFDRRWIENMIPESRGLEWACSMEEIDWKARGFDGRGLGYLLMQAGYFHAGHRAIADVDAVIQLLRHRFDDGTTAMAELVATSAKPSWVVRAAGAHFDVKDKLKGRGYRWDGGRKVWWREIRDDDRFAEEAWLASAIYCPQARPTALGPQLEQVTARTRFL